MPLEIVRKGQIDCPTIRCDHCGAVIADAHDGNYQWVMAPGGAQGSPLYFTHKRCCRAFESARPLPALQMWGAIELECLPIYLTRNLKIKTKHAASTARMMSGR